MKNIGKPCTGKPYARFDEGGLVLPVPYSTELFNPNYSLIVQGPNFDFFFQKVFQPPTASQARLGHIPGLDKLFILCYTFSLNKKFPIRKNEVIFKNKGRVCTKWITILY